MSLLSSKSKVPEGGDVNDIISSYRSSRLTKIVGLLVFLVIMLICAGYQMGRAGAYPISIGRAYEVFFDHLFHWNDGYTSLDMRVIWQMTVPRVAMAIFGGAALGACGAAMQSMLKNPLADPYTTGISSGASFGATIAIIYGFALVSGDYGIVINAFIFALIPALVIVVLSTIKKTSATSMILAGISVMYIFNALTSFIMLYADETAKSAAYDWTIGTLSKATLSNIPIVLLFTIAGCIFITYMTKYLNAMNSGDSYAKTIGVNVGRIRIILLVAISLIAAAVVSFTGIIGFVGLVGPHMARILLGSDNKFLIPGSMICGATLLLVADILSSMFTSTALPVGIITAIIGGPVFLLLILRQKKERW